MMRAGLAAGLGATGEVIGAGVIGAGAGDVGVGNGAGSGEGGSVRACGSGATESCTGLATSGSRRTS